ncbi:MAG TPA: universal stress protein [Gaiellaceae bacterium]|nr:universal stress protein [Gaiellaceae bacterium]
MGTIVVGVDGSPGSDAALRWAVGEARLRGSAVRVVHAYQPPHVPLAEAGLGGVAVPAVFTENGEELGRVVEGQARAIVDGALRRLDDDSTRGLEIEQVAAEGPATETLIEAARDAELLVLGSRGRGGFLGLLLGSVSQQCAQHPPCPVVILPPPEEAASSTAD